MTTVIKDVYTNYLSGGVVVSPPANNIELVAASAMGGPVLQKVTISDKTTAKQVFKGGEMLKALEERLDAGSQVIYAIRMASSNAAYSQLTLADDAAEVSITLKGAHKGTWWDGIEVDVTGTGATRTIEILDPVSEQIYSFTAGTVDDLVEAINSGQALVTAEKSSDTLPVAVSGQTLTGGHDGADLTNAEYLAAITLSEDYPDVNWVHFVGAADAGLWASILTSCDRMIADGIGERFALLDLPAFNPADSLNPTPAEIEAYKTTVFAVAATAKNRNAVFIAGNGRFTASDGTVYWNRLTSTLSGVMASLVVSRSLLGQVPVNVSAISPEWSRGSQVELVTNHVNHLRFQPGVGFIYALSENNPPTGDSYNRIEKLRSVYSAGKQVRAAAVPHLGRPNDSAGEGLKILEEDLKRPLDLMVQQDEIDSYELTVASTDEQRAQGMAVVILQVNSLKAFEIILENIYLD